MDTNPRFAGRLSIEGLSDETHQHELTGLPNRNWLDKRLPELLQAYDGKLTLFAIDADDLKDVNDTEGHAAGDRYIRFIAGVMADVLRISLDGEEVKKMIFDIEQRSEPNLEDYIAYVPVQAADPSTESGSAVHVSGDEFLVILPGVSSPELAVALAKRLQRELEELGAPISIGVAIHSAGDSAEDLRKEADDQLYMNKLQSKLEGYSLQQLQAIRGLYHQAHASGLRVRDMPLIADYLDTTPGSQYIARRMAAEGDGASQE